MLNNNNNTKRSGSGESVRINIIAERKDMVGICTIAGLSGEANVDEHKIQLLLTKEKIVHGIDQQAILELAKEYKKASKKIINLSAIVAKGQPAILGKDGVIEILVAPAEKVNIQKDGSADFRNISMFRKVNKGDVVAIKKAPIPGKKGINIFNKIVPTETPKEAYIEHGENIQFRPETHEYISLVDGIFDEKENWIDVNAVLKITSNVGLETGNIHYDGEIHIAGNVQREATVKTKGDLIIDGIIESGEVTSGGSIVAKLGINTRKEHKVVALKNIQANYVENSRIMAHKDVIIGNSILGSEIVSLGNVIMSSASSTISGSEISSYGNIEVSTIGTSLSAHVQITIGKHVLYAKKYEEVKEQLAQVRKEFYKQLEKVKMLKIKVEKVQGRLTKAEVENMKKQFNEYKVMAAHKEKLEIATENYLRGIYNPNTVKLIVRSTIYPGVEINYQNNIMNIDSEYQKVVFLFDPKTKKCQIRRLQN